MLEYGERLWLREAFATVQRIDKPIYPKKGVVPADSRRSRQVTLSQRPSATRGTPMEVVNKTHPRQPRRCRP